jgi:4-diphosphocytidyl-2-C-methyl-D-erythritol kinase
MIVFPNCKINLGLHILWRRQDGFHEIKSLLYPLSLSDCLEIIPSSGGRTEFSSSGIRIPGNGEKNLCQKAWDIVSADYNIPAVKIHLHKNTPIGAGLGGGSADAAYTLKLLNDLFSLSISKQQLLSMASDLGSDCAFFINNTPAIATGRGEILSVNPLSLKDYYLVLVVPPIHISTKEAYQNITPGLPAKDLDEILCLPIKKWRDRLVNDFEKGIFSKYPLLPSIKDLLYDKGALYASMSGSGSTVFGLFSNKPDINTAKIFPDCFIWEEKLKY